MRGFHFSLPVRGEDFRVLSALILSASAVWIRNRLRVVSVENICSFFQKPYLVFRICHCVSHSSFCMCVLEWMCLWVSVFWLCSLCFLSPSPFPNPAPLQTPCPAAEWHSNNEWCFCSRWLFWLWTLWASLSFILLGEYFEIKEKVDVTWKSFVVFVSLYLLVNKTTVLLRMYFVIYSNTLFFFLFAACSIEHSGYLCSARSGFTYVFWKLLFNAFMFRVTL